MITHYILEIFDNILLISFFLNIRFINSMQLSMYNLFNLYSIYWISIVNARFSQTLMNE